MKGISFLLFCALCFTSAWIKAENSAQETFNKKESLVYQVRVIDIGSGDKFSIGSGFLISDSGLVATNFHVVSSFVHEPEKFRLEYIASDDSVGELELIAIDVIHDLAIARTNKKSENFFSLSSAPLSKGERIYSMGNPNDLGMTIVEGTYNGLVEQSRYRKILFSGSLNPGMSGGPAMNQSGEIIGVNVSKGGEQISFLVPVERLKELIARLDEQGPTLDFAANIKADLMADQRAFFGGMASKTIEEKQLGDITIPDNLHDSLNCWGHTVDEEDIKYEAVHQHCQSNDQIYVSGNLYVGGFNYDVEMITTDELNRFQFYSLLEQRFVHRRHRNTRGIEEVSAYKCHDDLVRLASGSWKISSCTRPYKKYEGLYDASMIMASTDHPRRAAIVSLSATAIDAIQSQALFRRIMEAVSWNP